MITAEQALRLVRVLGWAREAASNIKDSHQLPDIRVEDEAIRVLTHMHVAASTLGFTLVRKCEKSVKVAQNTNEMGVK